MKGRIRNGSVILLAGMLAGGCGTPTAETGEFDRDAATGFRGSDAGEPSSLIEVDFGGGEAEVTKNLPADAAHKVGDAVKSTFKHPSQPDVTGE